jgi:type II secretory pathway component GspD/PulD (secretin)
MNSVLILAGITLALMLPSCGAYAQATESKPAEAKPVSDLYRTIYLSNATQQNDANDVQTALRNMLPRTKIYYVPSDGALTLRGTAEDIQLAQKMVADLDHPRKTYRLTYTMTETDGGKSAGSQRFVLTVVPGGKAFLKEGTKVPIVTGSTETGSSVANTQVQYVDVGLNIEASLDGSAEGLRLRSKVERSSVAEEKSNVGIQDPVIQQSTVEGASVLVQGKPFMLGAMDVPGSTRRLEIEVVSEVVK